MQIISIVLMVAIGLSIFGLNGKINDVNAKIGDVKESIPTVPSTDEIATEVQNRIIIPEPNLTEVNNKIAEISDKVASNEGLASQVAQLCKISDGCKYYEITGDDKDNAVELVLDELYEDTNKDLKEAVSELTKIDEDYLIIFDKTVKDSQVTAATKDDKEDENYDVLIKLRVKYKDKDESDTETIYLLIKAEIEDGDDVTVTNVEEVERDFEIE